MAFYAYGGMVVLDRHVWLEATGPLQQTDHLPHAADAKVQHRQSEKDWVVTPGLTREVVSSGG